VLVPDQRPSMASILCSVSVTDAADKRDGRAVYGMGGLDGLGGRIGGQKTMSAEWGGLGGREPQPCQGEGRGFESRRPLHFAEASHEISSPAEDFVTCLDVVTQLRC
jgi:hypothetical protein